MSERGENEDASPVVDLPPANEQVASDEAESVKGGLLSASQLTSGQVLKQSAQLSTSLDPGKVQGFECDGRS